MDDYEPFRNLVSSILEDDLGLQVVGEAAEGAEGLEKALELRPDLIALDIGLPVLSGIEMARQIRRLRPRSKILFLSATYDLTIVREAMATGADGYVLKSYLTEELSEAVQTVLAGDRFVTASFRDLLDRKPD